ncbi:MAG: NUDIX hydrolase [Pseudomonadota bacterium]
MPASTTSCGVLLLDAQQELLLCHATGAAHWDIPKGLAEPGEAPRDAAVRETFEETGLTLAPGSLLDLGRMAYRPGKDLHLFAAWSERFDPRGCVCTSLFKDFRGRMVPEADAFDWVPFERVALRCARSMRRVLTETLSLPDLWQRLKPADG